MKNFDFESIKSDAEDISKDLEECLEESPHKDELKDICEEFCSLKEIIESCVSVIKDYDEDVSEVCEEFLEEKEKLFQNYIEFGKKLIFICKQEEISDDSIEKFKECAEDCIEKIGSSLEQMNDFTTLFSNYKMDVVVGEEITEELVKETSEKYEKVEAIKEKATELFSSINDYIVECLVKLQKLCDEFFDYVTINESVKGEYWCVYQPHAAIFGVGKTEEEAWSDAEQWADTESDPNWKNSFEIKPCSEKLYNYTSEHGTPDDWVEVEGVIVTSEEYDQLNEKLHESLNIEKQKSNI